MFQWKGIWPRDEFLKQVCYDSICTQCSPMCHQRHCLQCQCLVYFIYWLCWCHHWSYISWLTVDQGVLEIVLLWRSGMGYGEDTSVNFTQLKMINAPKQEMHSFLDKPVQAERVFLLMLMLRVQGSADMSYASVSALNIKANMQHFRWAVTEYWIPAQNRP